MRIAKMNRLLPVTVSLGIAVISTSAMAATDWNYSLSGSCDPAVNSGTYVAQCNVAAPDLTMSGWSTGTGTVSAPSAGTTFAAAKIYDWGSSAGLGIVASNEDPNSTGPHSTDNKYGTDAFLLNFTNKVDLESVKIGWNGTDDFSAGSDISILAYTGKNPPASPTAGLNGLTLTALTSSGWTLVGNYGQVGSLTNNTATITSTVTSSWWLISAYNSGYGGAGSSSGLPLTAGNDYFKLLSVAGNNAPPPNQTPEPGSIALAGMGLLGLLASRRRKPKA